MASADSRSPVFVTGASGFVGSHLVDALLERGHRVTCLVRPCSDLRWLSGKPLRLEQGDLLDDRARLAELVSGHAVVFHVAGAVRAMDYKSFLRVNRDGTENILKACLGASPPPRRFVHVSSVGVAGPPPLGSRLTEDQYPGNLTDYGRSKLEAERLVLAFSRRLHVVVLRPSAIYGPRDGEMLPLFKLAGRLGILPAMGGGKQVLDLVHVQDVARGIVLAGDARLASGEVFLLGSGRDYSIAQLAEVMAVLFRRRVRLLVLHRSILWTAAAFSEILARISGRPAMLTRQKIPELVGSWRLDISRARSGLGYSPRWDLPEGMAQTLQWYRDRGWMPRASSGGMARG